MRRSARTMWLLVGSACVAALLTSAALALGAGVELDGGTAQLRSTKSDKVPPVRAIPHEVTVQFAEFRRAQRPSDRIPGDPVAALEDSGDVQPGENPLLARRLELGAGQNGYVWPMADGVCYSSPGPMGCVKAELLEKQGAVVGTTFASDTATVQVFGLVTDGVETVDLALADGREIAAPVRDGAFFIEVTTDPLKASWRRQDGSSATQAPLLMR